METLHIGEVIGGKYEVLKEIGRGGSSVVYLVIDLHIGKEWAIKALSKDHELYQYSRDEFSLLKRLNHSSLPRIVDLIERVNVLYVVMDYISGRTLLQVLDERGPIPQRQAVRYGNEICNVLKYLHSQSPPIIYRDLKPGNVILTPEGGIKLLDFGIAREYKNQSQGDTVCLGTRGYAAPEQFGGQGQSDARTDIYCFGTTFYHMITGKNPGKPPYELYPLRHWNKELSQGLEKVVLKCCRQDPSQRYEDADALRHDLIHYRELEDWYICRRRRWNRRIAISFIGAIGLFGMGIYEDEMRWQNRCKEYQYIMEQAVGDASHQQKKLYEAVDYMPEKADAYRRLVILYREQGFHKTEETKLVDYILMKEEVLQKDVNYPNLCFEVASLYMERYEETEEEPIWDSENQVGIRARFAYRWFQQVVQYKNEYFEYNYEVAKAYCVITAFYQKINGVMNLDIYNQREFVEFFQDMAGIVTDLAGENTNINTRENLFSLLKTVLQEYKFKFIASGIEEEKIESLLSKCGE